MWRHRDNTNVMFTETAFMVMKSLDPDQLSNVIDAVHDWFFAGGAVPNKDFFGDSAQAVAWNVLTNLRSVYVKGPTIDDISVTDPEATQAVPTRNDDPLAGN